MNLAVLPAQHRAPARQGARCDICPLRDCGEGPVLDETVEGAGIAFVGEAPGLNEVEEGRPFIGKSGQILNSCLKRGGYARHEVTITNSVLCRPPGGDMGAFLLKIRREYKAAKERDEAKWGRGRKRAPGAPEFPPFVLPSEACFPRLQAQLDKSNSRVICAVGGEALRAAAKYVGVPFDKQKAAPGAPRLSTLAKQQSAPLPLPDGRIVMATYHPAFAVRKGSRHWMPVIEDALVRTCDIARRGRIEWVEPQGIIDPSEDVAINYMDMLRKSGAMVMTDIETDSANAITCRLRCVGMGALVKDKQGYPRERAIVVPYRTVSGSRWYSREATERIAKANQALLDGAPLAGQHFAFDSAVLLRYRLMTSRSKLWTDDMIGHHNTDESELPHGLGFLASRYFEAPHWKDDADSKVVEHVSDRLLHSYNLKDVIGQLRLVKPVLQHVRRSGMETSYKIDIALAPHARDIGVLGMMFDEKRREELYAELHAKELSYLGELRRITGIPDFNPSAVRQVAKFLFHTKGLTPPPDPDDIEREFGRSLAVGTAGQAAAGEDVDAFLADDAEEPEGDEGAREEVSLDGISTNEAALIYLLDQGVDAQTAAFIDKQLEYRGTKKLIGTYLGYGIDKKTGVRRDRHRERGHLIDHKFGLFGVETIPIFHTWVNIHSIRTGRWATRPAIQNWPEIPVNMRDIVVAVPGHVFVASDFSQVELRIVTVLAGDEVNHEAYSRGLDIHSYNYATMMAKTGTEAEIMEWYDRVENAPKRDPKNGKALRTGCRKKAKVYVYLTWYGGEEEKLFKNMSVARDPDGTRSFPGLKQSDVAFWQANYHAKHPWLKRWHESVLRDYKRHGYVTTLMHDRKCYFLGGIDKNAMCNHGVQSLAADIMNRGALAVAERCAYQAWSPWSGPFEQVHDSLGLQVPEDRGDEAAALLETYMPWEYRGMQFPIELKRGTRWSQV